jgi:hypothetical protein
MRDFRDAKAMARSLRDALKAKGVETTHGECLELIARAFGYDGWNILSAKIGAEHHAGVAARSAPVARELPTAKTLHCSFCAKSQHEVQKLIAGPSVCICDECVELCMDIIGAEAPVWKVLSFLRMRDESGRDAYSAALEHVQGQSTGDVAAYLEQSKRGVEHNRLALQCIRRRLATRDGGVPAEDDVSFFADLNEKTKKELLALQQETERELKHYEDALRIATIVLATRRKRIAWRQSDPA